MGGAGLIDGGDKTSAREWPVLVLPSFVRYLFTVFGNENSAGTSRRVDVRRGRDGHARLCFALLFTAFVGGVQRGCFCSLVVVGELVGCWRGRWMGLRGCAVLGTCREQIYNSLQRLVLFDLTDRDGMPSRAVAYTLLPCARPIVAHLSSCRHRWWQNVEARGLNRAERGERIHLQASPSAISISPCSPRSRPRLTLPAAPLALRKLKGMQRNLVRTSLPSSASSAASLPPRMRACPAHPPLPPPPRLVQQLALDQVDCERDCSAPRR